MKTITVNWDTGKVETFYRGARTVRFVNHMRPETVVKLRHELAAIAHAGYVPQWYSRNEWVYLRGAA